MRFEGILTSWNDERGFGRIESTQGGEPIFVHVSAWPRTAGRPILNQPVTFEIELGPRGKRARDVKLIQARRVQNGRQRAIPAQWGTAARFAIPVFLMLYIVVAYLWRLPIWIAGGYAVASAITFVAYAADKSAAKSGSWRTPESTLHMFAFVGGWPGALLAQQLLRHKTSKREFRQVFWFTVALNIIILVTLASPMGRKLLGAQ